MSSDHERRKSLGRYVKRMSSVFKRDKLSAPSPQPDSSVLADPTHQHAPRPESPHAHGNKQPATPEPASQDDVAEPAPHAADVVPNEATPAAYVVDNLHFRPFIANYPRPAALENLTPVSMVQSPASVTTTALDRNAMQQQRARDLFAKYGLSLDTHEWIATSAPAPLVPRVEKSIRMRVHRSCHRCGTFYGAERVCQQCDHKRCKKCPRYPKKKSADKGDEAEDDEKPRKKRVLTVTTRAGNELTYQPPKQRIKRACHKCEAPFIPPTATLCEECRHVRCTKCPRDPAKLSKWADGYPGDVEANSDDEVEKQRDSFRRIWRRQRRIVRWECELCNTMFRQGSPMCPGCGHERCDQCTRSP
jgi:hypothetical protein